MDLYNKTRKLLTNVAISEINSKYFFVFDHTKFGNHNEIRLLKKNIQEQTNLSWGYSNTQYEYSMKQSSVRLYSYWFFESKDDAVVFKLLANNAISSVYIIPTDTKFAVFSVE